MRKKALNGDSNQKFFLKWEYYLIASIALCALLIRLFYAQTDTFLHTWDESFHALVASNLIDNPLIPRLHTENLFKGEHYSWTSSYIWLHKPPLFLWQMMLFIDQFGASPFVIRLPSIIMHVLSVFIIYRIANLLGLSVYGRLIAIFLFAISRYNIEMAVGVIGMDHNDVSFGFYFLIAYWL